MVHLPALILTKSKDDAPKQVFTLQFLQSAQCLLAGFAEDDDGPVAVLVGEALYQVD